MLIETILRMSFSATFIIVALVVLRPFLKKLPGGMRAALWVMVAIRLLCPVFMESQISLVPDSAIVARDEIVHYVPPVHDTVVPDNQGTVVGTTPSAPVIITPVVKESKPLSFTDIAQTVWIAGLGVMAMYFAVEYIRLKRRVSASISVGDDIRVCDDINTSFIVGIIKPVIYLPSYLDVKYRDMIINHERMHISRCDHLQKVFGYLVLALHWFNPFVWVAYVLFCKDIELACDEKAIKGHNDTYKKLYATAILYGCTERVGLSPCRVAFGEIGIKQRVKNVLKYKKARFWLVVAGVAIAAIIAGCFLTNPVSDKEPSENSADGGEHSKENMSTGETTEDNTSLDLSAEDSENLFGGDASTESEESLLPPEVSEDNSSAAPKDNSSAAPEDNSSTQPEDNSSTAPEDNSSVPPEDNSSTQPEDNSSVPPEDNSSEAPQVKPAEWYSIQNTHETPEHILMRDQLYTRLNVNRISVYIKIRSYSCDKDGVSSTAFTDRPVKVWLCDKYGNKIDYVYSNSHGMVVFNVFKGEYTLQAEAVDGYFALSPYGSYLDLYEPVMIAVYAMPEIKLYDVNSFRTSEISVIDANSKQPVKAAEVYCKAYFSYTDSQSGKAVIVITKSENYTEWIEIMAEGYETVKVRNTELGDSAVIELKPLS